MAQFHTSSDGTVSPDTPGPQADHTPQPTDKNSNYNTGVRNWLKASLTQGNPVGPGDVKQLKAMR
jgi:hypothetical protein